MIDTTILSALIYHDDYARKVLPYLAKDYFSDIGHQILYKLIKDFSQKYNKSPTKESLQIELEESSLAEKPFDAAKEVLDKLTKADVDVNWLADQTEQFCKRQALFNAITASADLLAKSDSANYGQMLDHVQKALAVSFDADLGHDYLRDAEKRFEYYHDVEEQLACSLSMLNKVTNGGLRRKSFTVFIAPTGGGKSIVMCHLAADYLMAGKNVLYITMEMGAEDISQRIDANLLDVDINMLKKLDKSSFMNRIHRLRTKAAGRLMVKQFPTSSAHVGHFRHLVNELKLKEKFIPDVIIVDYLNICDSARAPKGANSYERGKIIAEELRGLGVELGCQMISATQVNREGAASSDFEITNTSESFGVPMTVDYMFAVINTTQLEQLNRLKIKQLKNRYNSISDIKSFLVDIDRSRMRLSDCEEDADNYDDDEPNTQKIEKVHQDQEKINSFEERFASLMVD